MSAINTNGINVSYPVPGVNNDSQGFRDNFTSITTNLNTAATEITDVQKKAVVKSALTNTTINNDMANTLLTVVPINACLTTTLFCKSVISVPAVFKLVTIEAKLSLNP